jgi:two-component system, NarL family, nitrate/nitrite response regulator NarL
LTRDAALRLFVGAGGHAVNLAAQAECNVNILLVDDHHLVREALANYLRQREPTWTIDEAGTLGEAVEKARAAEKLDLVVLDYFMPDMDGLGGLERLRTSVPGVRVAILSGNISPDEAEAAIESGAVGVISKGLRGHALVMALNLILSGEVYLSSNLARRHDPDAVHAARREQRHALGNLTHRQLEAVKLLVRGLSNQEIADRLELAEGTVKLHLRNAFEKMGARNRADAVRIALSRGLGKQ